MSQNTSRLDVCRALTSVEMLMEMETVMAKTIASYRLWSSQAVVWRRVVVGPGRIPGQKLISVLSKRQIMLLVEAFVVNWGPARRRLLREKHSFGDLGVGDRPLPWIRNCSLAYLSVQNGSRGTSPTTWKFSRNWLPAPSPLQKRRFAIDIRS